jgi:heptosyltransferase-2
MDIYGKARALNPLADAKLLTGVFNDISMQNKKSYPEEIFEICGFNYQGEKYILDNHLSNDWPLDHSHKIVGLNTGCGARWPSRLWPVEHWKELATSLQQNNIDIIWLGGPEEHERNTRLQNQIGGKYFGIHSLPEYINIVGQCDLVVTQVTMTLHIALGLSKKVVLMNNIFNKNEFELFDLGVIIEPEPLCGCYYSPVCPHDSMKSIHPERMMSQIMKILL